MNATISAAVDAGPGPMVMVSWALEPRPSLAGQFHFCTGPWLSSSAPPAVAAYDRLTIGGLSVGGDDAACGSAATTS